MADKLDVMNGALRHLGEPPLRTVDQEDEIGRRMREVWRPAVKRCLEAGTWNFAEELAQLQRLATTPTFGYSYYYAKPSGWLRTNYISETGLVDDPLKEYKDQGGKIACSRETIYMAYVHEKYIDLVGPWHQAFADYASVEMAIDVAPRFLAASAEKMDELKVQRRNMRAEAFSFDAINNPPVRMARGRWARAGRASGRLGKEHRW